MVLTIIEECLTRGGWEGTAAELWAALHGKVRYGVRLPANPNALALQLRRLAPNLRRAGFAIEFLQTTGRGSKKLIRLHPACVDALDAADAATTASPTGNGDWTFFGDDVWHG